MLVVPKQDMVYRNAFRPAGVPFEYDGKVPPVCCVPAGASPEPAPVEAPKRSYSKNSDK